ncbi:MAG TPA: WecB/TagA/CpsF family glycosyltransferase [Rhodopila sp.]|uniref:WecB/TagA/CpsF family glycosyltransferase n=1 Tax=Rhodopila sp. TaxID=2480087 RepID=UPI002C0B0A0A|nr:WecB/TagA/CpsF family glycosyltransferase [Rhodopila sp.]HVY17102.1 WecB/TagA/CpsF family glycosyltransferase [Rhodopila sp.]
MSEAFAYDSAVPRPSAQIVTLRPPAKTSENIAAGDDRRIDVLGVGISPANLPDVVATLDSWRTKGLKGYVCCVSVHGIVTAQRDPKIRAALNGAQIATKDGMPMAWWCRRSGDAASRRVCGSDLFDAVCRYGIERGYRHYFYGGSPAVVEQLAQRVKEAYPGIIVAGYRSPPFRALTPEEDAAYIAEISASGADFVWVGLGMPKQERWMAQMFGKIEASALLGVGAVFDFYAGTKPRAPLWMQRSGTEWLFRLASEPRRLAKRYLIDNSIFVGLTIRHIVRQGFRRGANKDLGPSRLSA